MVKLNINNEEWLIMNGVLKEYRGTSKDITIPEGVVEIADEVFLHCLIKSVILPKSLKKIGKYAFLDNHIKELIIPESVEEIGYEAFSSNKISKLTFHSSLKHIGPLAFICIELEVLKIPPQFNIVDNFALSEVKKIIFTTMPNLDECSKITELMKEYPNIDFVYEDLTTTINLKTDLALYINNEEWLIENRVLKEYRGNSSVVVIPEGVEVIDCNVFFNKKVSEVKFPSTLKIIENSAFQLTLLSKLELPEGLEEIDNFAFGSCNLTEVKFPKTLKKIGWHSFEANKLSVITLTEGITYIDDRAFVFNPIEELTIFNIIETNLRNSLYTKEIITLNLMKKLSKRELDHLSKLDFANLKTVNIYFEPTISEMFKLKIIFKNAKVKKQSIAAVELKTNDLSSDDQEINELLKSINISSKILEPVVKETLDNMIKKLLETYKSDLDSIRPKINFNEEDITLKTNIINPRILKNNLLQNLSNILNKLNASDSNRKLLTSIKAWQELLTQEDIALPTEITDINSKIEYLIYVAKKYNLKNIIITLEVILKNTALNISNELSFSTESKLVLNSDFKELLFNQINDLYENSKERILLIEALNFEGDSSLTKDLNTLKDIISFLDEKNKDKYNEELNKVVNEYKNILNSNNNYHYESLVLEIRTKLQIILESIAEVLPNILSYKELLNDLNTSIEILDNNTNTNSKIRVITSLVLDILVLSNNEYITSEEKVTINNKLKEIILKWKNRIINNESYALNLELEYNLNNDLIIILCILKDLTKIKLVLENYFVDEEEYQRALRII